METAAKKSLSKKDKMKVGALSALTGALLVTGSMAFFTDRVETNASATSGTVEIGLTSNWQDVANFNPGDITDISYEISSLGNKSVDIREKLVVKSSEPMTDIGQAEFEIYKKSDVTQDAYGAYTPNAGAEPITIGEDRIINADKTAITYLVDEYVLNGTGTAAETEDGINATTNESEYVLVFKKEASNAFQGVDVTVDLVAEAKQHRNTGADTWAEVATENIVIGGESANVVPATN